MEVGAHDTQRRSRDVLASQEDAQEMKKRIRFTRCYSEISKNGENCWQKLLAKAVGKNCWQKLLQFKKIIIRQWQQVESILSGDSGETRGNNS